MKLKTLILTLSQTLAIVSDTQSIDVNLNAHCTDGRIDECTFDKPYIPLSKPNGASYTMSDAQLHCQSEYGTTLASIDESITNTVSVKDQFTQMKDLCKAAGPNQPCWTSALRNTNNRDEFILDNDFIISTDTHANVWQYNESFFAENEGNGNNEDCIALYHAKAYQMSDWPCEGNGVTIALCANPNYNLDNQCRCSCNKCTVFGDPHIYTFDDLFYHSFV